MQIESIPISKLKLLEKNPRRITKEQMEKLCKSIQDDPDFLNARPILVNLTYIDDKPINTVYAGNQRVRAAKKLKMKEIPCIIENDLCPEIMKKRTILDNKTFGSFDFDILANEWDIDLLLDCGFTAEELFGGVQDINTDNDRMEDKEKKAKECPHCGGEL